MLSSLITRNIRIAGRRTSVRLEPALWDALEEICRLEEIDMHNLCTRIAGRPRKGGYTSALRVYILQYFRNQLGRITREAA